MISLESIRGFFPEELRAGQFAKHILKEYVEWLALEWIARSPWAAKLTFKRTEPDYLFLSAVHPEVTDLKSLKAALKAKAQSVNLELKRRDVEHLLFHRERADLVTRFPAFIETL